MNFSMKNIQTSQQHTIASKYLMATVISSTSGISSEDPVASTLTKTTSCTWLIQNRETDELTSAAQGYRLLDMGLILEPEEASASEAFATVGSRGLSPIHARTLMLEFPR